MDVSRVKTDARAHVRIHRRAEGEMTTETHAHHTEFAGAGGMRFQKRERDSCVVIIAGNGFGYFKIIPLLRACRVVTQHRSSG